MTATPRKNNEGETRLTLKEIAERLGGELIGDPGILVAGAAGIKEAKKDEITFFSNPRYLPYLEETQAAAVITSKDVQPKNKPVIRVENPSLAFTNVLSLFVPPIPERKPGVHPTAVVDPSVEIGSSVSIGPYAVIEEGCRIGEGSALDAHVYVGRETRLGQGCIIYPNVTIRERCSLGNRVIVHSGTVIGSDGFGYETVKGKHQKIPHYGCVVIEDDVEIGSNVSIDRGRFDKTWIKEGSKIDNLVQIAHNVVVGPHCLIVSQAGISGSTELGRNVVIAGQSGIVGHITLGDEVIVGAGAGVTKSWPEKTILLGGPAKPISEQKKIFALIARLPELFRDMAKLKKNQTN